MAADLQIKHRFVSGLTGNGNTSLLQPEDWNANITGNGSIGLVAFTGNGTVPFRTIVVAGTSNQVTVANGNGSADITLSLPQNIHSGASPTFAGLTLSGLTVSRVVVTDGSKAASSSAVTATELGHLSGVTSAVQTQIDGKQPTVDANTSLSAGNLTLAGLTASRALVSDANKTLTPSAVTATELGHLSGVTSAVQTQLDAKQASITSASNITAGNLTLAGPANNSLLALDATGKAAAVTIGANLTYDAANKTLSAAGGGGGTPAGNTTYVQLNNNGAFGASANLTYDANGTLNVKGASSSVVAGLKVRNSSNDTWSASDITLGKGEGTNESAIVRYRSSVNEFYIVIAGDNASEGGLIIRRNTEPYTLEAGTNGKFRCGGFSTSAYSTDTPAGAVIGSFPVYDASGTEIGLVEVKARNA